MTHSEQNVFGKWFILSKFGTIVTDFEGDELLFNDKHDADAYIDKHGIDIDEGEEEAMELLDDEEDWDNARAA